MRLLGPILTLILISAKTVAQVQYEPWYHAGNEIVFLLQNELDSALLVADHSFGTSVIEGVSASGSTTFRLPSIISSRRGTVSLKIMRQQQLVWEGQTEILADTLGYSTLESYCGPKHLVVAVNDFTMLTTTVLDEYDNPYPERTPIEARSMIQNQSKSLQVESDGLIAFARIYAPAKSGYGAVSANFKDISSKEFRLDFYTADPFNFTVSIRRQHDFADGNQLVTLSTSEIKDRFGNFVENGTIVYFYLTDHLGRLSSATASTIDGVAEIHLPAPNYPTSWTISAIIPHYAQSNQMALSFKRAITRLPVIVSDTILQIGPVTSFLGQLAKEGMLISIRLDSGQKIQDFDVPIENGFASLNFRKQLVQPGTYTATIELGDLTEELTLTVHER